MKLKIFVYMTSMLALQFACVNLPAREDEGSGASSDSTSQASDVAGTQEAGGEGEVSDDESVSTGASEAATAETSGDGDGDGDGGEEVDWNALSDDFEAEALDDAWRHLDLDAFLPLPDVDQGAAHFYPSDDTAWFNDRTAGLLYKNVSVTQFRVSSTIHLEAFDGSELLPEWRVAGIVMRDGADDGENWAFVGLGTDDAGFNVETKATENGVSNRVDYAAPQTLDGEVRLCRVGNTFLGLWRGPLGWENLENASLGALDLPAEVQVGLAAADWNPQSDSHMWVDDIVFAPVSEESDCYADD